MNKAALVGGLLIIGTALYVALQPQAVPQGEGSADDGGFGAGMDDVLSTANDAFESMAEGLDSVTGGFLKISAMARVTPDMLNNGNVQAMLRVIRRGEGTADDGGYNRLFGGGTFSGYVDHPRQSVTKSGYTSTAAGAYQILSSTWDETRRIMKLPDFSPRSQDLAAVGRIMARGALEDVLAGRFTKAIEKISREWASLPGSPYGQPRISWATALAVFNDAGGVSQTATV